MVKAVLSAPLIYKFPAANAICRNTHFYMVKLRIFSMGRNTYREMRVEEFRSWPLGRVFDPEAQTRRELRAERLGASKKATGIKA
jgi:hypothetical protein